MNSSQQTVSIQVSKTVLLLIQAFLKTGYYNLGHPETEKAREGLYEAVTALFNNHSEITFMANAREDTAEILVGGVANDYLAMSKIMPHNMADIFLPKLADFFRRKRLSSFSLRKGISRDEFTGFVDIMTHSDWLEDSRVDVCQRMSSDLVAKQIVNVSVVFLNELVGHGRRLPWRVVATLSRLKRDLNILPLYRHVDQNVINRVRRQVFKEIVAPLRDIALIHELLVNLDLIVESLHGFTREILINSVLEYIDPIYIPQACRLVVKDLDNLRKSLEDLVDDAPLRRGLEEVGWVARQLGDKLLEGDEPVDAIIFQGLVRHRVYLRNELPEPLMKEINTLDAVTLLLEDPTRLFAEIEHLVDPDEFVERLWQLLEMLPELFRQGRDPVAREVIAFARRYGEAYNVNQRPRIVEGLLRAATERAQHEGREGVNDMLATIAALDWTGLEILVDLADHENRSVRRLGIEALVERGEAAIPVLFAALKKKEGWHFLRNMLVLLPRIGVRDPDVEKLLRRCLAHPQAHIRIEAAQALAKLYGAKGEEAIAKLLNDKEGEVRQRAVGALADTGINQPRTIDRLAELLHDGKNDGEAMALQVVGTLNNLKPGPFKESGIEDALCELVSPKRRFGFGFGGKETALTSHLREGAVLALGYVGTQRCRSVVEKCAKEEGKISVIAKGALNQLNGRLTVRH